MSVSPSLWWTACWHFDDGTSSLGIFSDAGKFHTAAIFHHVADEVGEKLEIRGINDGTSFPPRLNQTRMIHMGEMERQGVMGNIERFAQHSGGRTVLSVFHQQAEHAQAGIL
jgi:hypothetical protein